MFGTPAPPESISDKLLGEKEDRDIRLGDVSSDLPRNERSGFRRATQTPHKRLSLWKSPEKIPWELRSKAAFRHVHSGKIWVFGHTPPPLNPLTGAGSAK
jgi:hypothetical protein